MRISLLSGNHRLLKNDGGSQPEKSPPTTNPCKVLSISLMLLTPFATNSWILAIMETSSHCARTAASSKMGPECSDKAESLTKYCLSFSTVFFSAISVFSAFNNLFFPFLPVDKSKDFLKVKS